MELGKCFVHFRKKFERTFFGSFASLFFFIRKYIRTWIFFHFFGHGLPSFFCPEGNILEIFRNWADVLLFFRQKPAALASGLLGKYFFEIFLQPCTNFLMPAKGM